MTDVSISTQKQAPATRPAGPPAEPPAGRWLRWPASRAPARPELTALLISTVISVTALTALVAAGRMLSATVLIPPLAASMALIAGAPALPLAQPRSVVGGQFASAATGLLLGAALGHGLWVAALAGGVALGVMLLLRVSHSPAAATAVLVVLQAPAPAKFLLLLAVGTALLVGVGTLGARLARKPYPVYWW